MPVLHNTTLLNWWKNHFRKNEELRMKSQKTTPHTQSPNSSAKRVYLFCDEFTNYNDVEIGKKSILTLEKLGYEVIIPQHGPSGRPQLSKGLLKDAKKIAEENIRLLKDVISYDMPLVGIEPSAILTFRDEYPDLVGDEYVEDAKKLAQNALQFDEFIAREIELKHISRDVFTKKKKLIKLHGHCQQKAISSMVPTKKMLSLPENYTVQLIPSGCCGMAGSFGYEKEHYDISMQIGELVLFPTVRQQPEEVIIAAPGTSCRHQIHDGTGRKAMHPAEILWEAFV
jgi:Fe-S oxidoreductase